MTTPRATRIPPEKPRPTPPDAPRAAKSRFGKPVCRTGGLGVVAYDGRMTGRHTRKQTERTLALGILAVGAAVSIASLFGGAWVMRAGVMVALVVGVAATWVAFRQLRYERRAHQEEVAQHVEEQRVLINQHHTDSVAMIDRFTERANNLTEQIGTLRRQLGSAKAELSTMRGNSAWLRGEVAERQARIEALTRRVEELEARLAEKDSEDSLLPLPRYGRAALQPSVHDIWADDEHPTMVDLASVQLDPALEERKLA